MSENTTIIECAQWVIKHRTGFAFKDYSLLEICETINQAIKDGAMYVVFDNNEIIGLACGKIDPEMRVCHIVNILTTSPKAMPEIAKMFHKQWPFYTLESLRKNKFLRVIKPETLEKILTYG